MTGGGSQPAERRRCTGDPCANMAPGLCRWHRDRLARELAAFPELVAELERQLAPSRAHGDGRGGGEQGIGVRVDVLSALGPSGDPSADDGTLRPGTEADQVGATPLWAVLTSWARLVAEEFTYAQERSWTFATARGFLVRQHQRICAQPWADDYAAEVHEAWQTAMTLTGRWESAQPQRDRYCPYCRKATLYQQPGVDEYECQERAGGCGRRMSREDYDRMTMAKATYARKAPAVVPGTLPWSVLLLLAKGQESKYRTERSLCAAFSAAEARAVMQSLRRLRDAGYATKDAQPVNPKRLYLGHAWSLTEEGHRAIEAAATEVNG